MKIGKKNSNKTIILQKIIPVHRLLNPHLQIPIPLHLLIVLLVPQKYHYKKNRSELFKVLDLKIFTSSIECKKAYKKLARQYHPDKWKSIKPFSKLKGNAQLQNISNAHEEICMLKNLF